MLSPELQQLLHHGGWECSGKLDDNPQRGRWIRRKHQINTWRNTHVGIQES